MANYIGYAILPTTAPVKTIYELIARMPPYYGINPTLMVMTVINAMSLSNPALLEYYITEFMTEIEFTSAGNGSKLDKIHEQELAKAIINLWHILTTTFTRLQLWDENGTSFWKFHAFTGYDIILRYTGVREDVPRVVQNIGDQ